MSKPWKQETKHSMPWLHVLANVPTCESYPCAATTTTTTTTTTTRRDAATTPPPPPLLRHVTTTFTTTAPMLRLATLRPMFCAVCAAAHDADAAAAATFYVTFNINIRWRAVDCRCYWRCLDWLYSNSLPPPLARLALGLGEAAGGAGMGELNALHAWGVVSSVLMLCDADMLLVGKNRGCCGPAQATLACVFVTRKPLFWRCRRTRITSVSKRVYGFWLGRFITVATSLGAGTLPLPC